MSPAAIDSVILLSDAHFFVRVVPVAADAAPEAAVAEAELALEAQSPFPLAQLYYGVFHPPGADRALVYAAYHRRFPAAQSETWTQADWVAPAFTAALGLTPDSPRRLLAPCAGGLTLIEWTQAGPVPAQVVSRVLAAEAAPEERAAMREALLAQSLGDGRVVELAEPLACQGADDRETLFASGETQSRLPAAGREAMDVRPKAQLAELRVQRGRDTKLWRVFAGCLIALAACLVLELALIGGKLWLQTRATVAQVQRPAVQAIMSAQSLAARINDLSTKQLRPFEMLALLNQKRPGSVQFLRTTTDGLYKIQVEAQTSSPADVAGYQAALAGLDACDHVEVQDLRTRGGQATFTLVVTFKSAALRAVTQS